MKSMIKAFVALVVVLPFFAHASDGAEAAKRFQERNKALFAQQAKDRVAKENLEIQAKEAEAATDVDKARQAALLDRPICGDERLGVSEHSSDRSPAKCWAFCW